MEKQYVPPKRLKFVPALNGVTTDMKIHRTFIQFIVPMKEASSAL
jgi:hypothetical protein